MSHAVRSPRCASSPVSLLDPRTALLAVKHAPPPLRLGVVVRRASLASAPASRITLVSAPPGYGKTTLVRSWFGATPDDVAWVTLDEGDNDPAVFTAYLAAAVGTVPSTAAALAARVPDGPDDRVTAVLNALVEAAPPVRLVLDDYHAIRSPAVHALVARIVRNLRAPAGLVLVTRQDPPLPLARVRSAGDLAEVRSADLRFSPEDGVAFLRTATGPGIDDRRLAAVVERAEGWPAALQLAALTLRAAPDPEAAAAAFGGTDRYVLEYLTEEILAQQPERIRTFLEATCVADWLSGELADALTGDEGGQATLEALEDANLPVARLDERGDAWRYHALLAEMLRAGLGPERRAALDLVAADWFEARGMTPFAVQHFLRAGAYGRASEVIGRAGDATLARGEFVTFVAWCDALPPAVMEGSPGVRVLHAWARFMLGDFAGAGQSLALMGADGSGDARVASRRRCLEAWFANRRDSPDAEALARAAVEATRDDNRTFRSLAHTTLGEALIGVDARAARLAFEEAHRLADPSGPTALRFGTVYSLALTLLTEGRRHDAEQLCRDTVDAATARGRQPPGLGMVLLLLGIARYEADDLVAARQHIATGWELCERGGLRALLLGAAEWHEALVLHALGQREQAWQRVESVRRAGRRHGVARIGRAMSALAAELLLREGDVVGATARVADAADGPPPLGATRDRIALTSARVALARGDWRRAAATAEPLLTAQRAGNRLGRAAESLVLLASAYARGGDPRRATASLEEALGLCSGDGRLSVFLDPVFPLAPALVRSRHVAPPFVDDLLGRLGAPGHAPRRPAPRPASGSVAAPTDAGTEPLSARELEVLRLVAAGLSNEEIGRELFVTAGTAKWHVHNLLGKSGARDRVGLVAWAHRRALA